jgi:Flp pilus assembly protein TadG
VTEGAQQRAADLTRGRDRERGSAVADFVMVTGLVLFIFLGVFQLGLVLHTRNTLFAAAAEGARVAARADAAPEDGILRTQELIRAQLADRYAEQVSAGSETVDGARVMVVRVIAPVPVIGPFGPGDGLDVSSRAYAEQQ